MRLGFWPKCEYGPLYVGSVGQRGPNPTWQARPGVPISALDMGWTWGVPVNPSICAGYGEAGCVAVFRPGTDRAAHPVIWGRV